MRIKLKLLLSLYLIVLNAWAQERVIGITKPLHDIELSFPVDGIVEAVLVKEGEKVKKGQALVRLENQLQMQEVARRNVLLADQSKVNTTQYHQKTLETILHNNQQLHHYLGAVSREEIKKLEMQMAGIKGDLGAALQEKKREKIELDMAKNELDRRILRSPIEGVITEINIDEGEWAQPGKNVLRLVNTQRSFLDVNVPVSEVYLRHLAVNTTVSLEFDLAGQLIKKEGRISYLSPLVDKSSGLVRVKIEFDNSKGDILLGIAAKILLPEPVKKTSDLVL